MNVFVNMSQPSYQVPVEVVKLIEKDLLRRQFQEKIKDAVDAEIVGEQNADNTRTQEKVS